MAVFERTPNSPSYFFLRTRKFIEDITLADRDVQKFVRSSTQKNSWFFNHMAGMLVHRRSLGFLCRESRFSSDRVALAMADDDRHAGDFYVDQLLSEKIPQGRRGFASGEGKDWNVRRTEKLRVRRRHRRHLLTQESCVRFFTAVGDHSTAPRSRRNAAISFCLRESAKASGDLPSFIFALRFAPCSSSIVANSRSPLAAAS